MCREVNKGTQLALETVFFESYESTTRAGRRKTSPEQQMFPRKLFVKRSVVVRSQK